MVSKRISRKLLCLHGNRYCQLGVEKSKMSNQWGQRNQFFAVSANERGQFAGIKLADEPVCRHNSVRQQIQEVNAGAEGRLYAIDPNS